MKRNLKELFKEGGALPSQPQHVVSVTQFCVGQLTHEHQTARLRTLPQIITEGA